MRETQAYYDRLSHWYDLLAGSSERKVMLQAVKMLAVKPGERALEIGFGTGHALVELATMAGVKGCVVGLDLSTGMAAVTQKRVDKKMLDQQVCLCCGDGRALPFSLGWADAILLSFTLELFEREEIGLVLGACWQVLKPGGRLAVVGLSQPEGYNFWVAVYQWFHLRFPQYIDCRPIRVKACVEQEGFEVLQAAQKKLLGFLPLEIVLAKKKMNV